MDVQTRTLADEAATAQLGSEMATWLRRGDFVALKGDLGAGKTALARAILRALAKQEGLEVPSPTFTLVQTYDTGWLPVGHFDLYRLENAEDLEELGLDAALDEGAVLVEWPERLGGRLPDDRLDVHLMATPDDQRRVRLTGHGGWRRRLKQYSAQRRRAKEQVVVQPMGSNNSPARDSQISRFIAMAGWQTATRTSLQGDASTRSYEWLHRPTISGQGTSDAPASAFLMNWPQVEEKIIESGKTYRQLASLAESVTSFLGVGSYLRVLGLSAPQIYAADRAEGLLLLEDLGRRVFGDLIRSGTEMMPQYEAATEALARLQSAPAPAILPVSGGQGHVIPRYTVDICLIEIDLLTAWAWPAVKSSSCPPAEIGSFRRLWADLFATLSGAQTLMLRDFHSPNLLWLPKRQGAARVGLIDHQDAVLAHAVYDVVSLGQDARVDISEARERMIVDAYLGQMPGILALDTDEFLRCYAIFGAQRAVRLIGLFVRLARQDGKPQYLAHLPRVTGYLTRNLRHTALAELKAWIERHFGADFAVRFAGIGTEP